MKRLVIALSVLMFTGNVFASWIDDDGRVHDSSPQRKRVETGSIDECWIADDGREFRGVEKLKCQDYNVDRWGNRRECQPDTCYWATIPKGGQ